MNVRQVATASVGIAVVGLLLWEVVQRGSSRLRFDWNDMAATLLGGILCGLVVVRMIRRSAAGR